MKATDGQEAYDTHIECPKCHADGLVTTSGYVPTLLFFTSLEPHFHCTGIHGAISDAELLAYGVDPTPPPNRLPSHEPGLGADPRHPEPTERPREGPWVHP